MIFVEIRSKRQPNSRYGSRRARVVRFFESRRYSVYAVTAITRYRLSEQKSVRKKAFSPFRGRSREKNAVLFAGVSRVLRTVVVQRRCFVFANHNNFYAFVAFQLPPWLPRLNGSVVDNNGPPTRKNGFFFGFRTRKYSNLKSLDGSSFGLCFDTHASRFQLW